MSYIRYTLYLIGGTIGLSALIFAVEKFTGLTAPSAATGMIVVFVIAQMGGQQFAVKHNRIPEKHERRSFAKVALIVNFVFAFVILVPLIMLSPDLREAYTSPNILGIVAGIFVLLFAFIYWASGRAFQIGARNHLKLLAKQAARKAKKLNKK